MKANIFCNFLNNKDLFDIKTSGGFGAFYIKSGDVNIVWYIIVQNSK